MQKKPNHSNFSDTGFFYDYSRQEHSPSVNIHMHDWYEIYYFISGDVTYYVEGQSYRIKPNDILITNNRELHRPIFESDCPYERAIIQFTPTYVSPFQSADYNLLDFFEKRKLGCYNRLSTEEVFLYKINETFDRLQGYINASAPENPILIKTAFIEMLVTFNKIFAQKQHTGAELYEYDKKVLEILDYINNHLEEKITLDILENAFFVNKYYLCHIFKKSTGFTVVEYITYKRIMKAKELLMTGMPVIEACHNVGFNDYSNFYKVFRKLTGTTPRNYSI